MKAKLSTLLIALALCLVALPAQAQFTWLDDPDLTTADGTDRIIMLSGSGTDPNTASAISATQSSDVFTANGASSILLTIPVTACVGSCNVTVQVQCDDPTGAWTPFTAFSVTTTGTWKFLISPYAGTSVPSGMSALMVKPLPPRFRVSVVWVSGTSITYTVHAVVW